MEDNLAKLWAECDAKISSIGSSTHARKCRHKYMASDLTDERYDLFFAIVSAEVRQALEVIFDKWGITPEEMQAESRVKKSRTPRPPKAKDWAQSGTSKATKKNSGLSVRDAEMPDEFDD